MAAGHDLSDRKELCDISNFFTGDQYSSSGGRAGSHNRSDRRLAIIEQCECGLLEAEIAPSTNLRQLASDTVLNL